MKNTKKQLLVRRKNKLPVAIAIKKLQGHPELVVRSNFVYNERVPFLFVGSFCCADDDYDDDDE